MSLLLSALFVLSGGLTSAPHKFHVTNGRMAVEGSVAACEIRFFRHDLEEAIARYHGLGRFELNVGARQDSLFQGYLDAVFVVGLNGDRVQGSILGSGQETVDDEEIWWYMIQYEAPEPILRLAMTNRLLFDLFDDQRNILRVQHFPSEMQTTFYFVTDSDHREIKFPD